MAKLCFDEGDAPQIRFSHMSISDSSKLESICLLSRVNASGHWSGVEAQESSPLEIHLPGSARLWQVA